MIRTIQNDPLLGGVSYNMSVIEDVTKLPPEYRDIITDLEISALSDHSAFFAALREKCRFPPMQEWLSLIVASESVSLTTYIDDRNQRAATIDTLGGSLCLTPSSLPECASDRLREVFDVVGSIHQCGFGQPYVLGVDMHGTIEEFDEHITNYSSGPPAGSYVVQFYNADCGNRLLAVGDQVYHYHIGGAICAGNSLENVLTEYFNWLSGNDTTFRFDIPYENVKPNAT